MRNLVSISLVLLTLLPAALWLLSGQNWVLPGAWTLQAAFVFAFWPRDSSRAQTEALSKLIVSVLLGISFLNLCWLGAEQSSWLWWPLHAENFSEGWRQAILGGAWCVACALLLAWIPLQQGWPDVWEVLGYERHSQFRFLSLYVSLLCVLYLLGRELLVSLNLTGLVPILMAWLGLSKLVLGVQMSVYRSIGYGLSSLSWPLLISWSFADEPSTSILVFLACLVGLVFLLRVLSSLAHAKATVQWDDPKLPPEAYSGWKHFLRWDFFQTVLTWPLLLWTEKYGMLGASLFVAMCQVSVLSDRKAFKPRRLGQVP